MRLNAIIPNTNPIAIFKVTETIAVRIITNISEFDLISRTSFASS